MPNENINPVNRLNDYRSRIENFAEFENVFMKLDKSRQEKTINFFKNAPRKTRTINKFANKLIDLNRAGKTGEIYIAIEQETLSLNLKKRNDLSPTDCEGFKQFMDGYPNQSQIKYLEIANDNIWHIDEGKIPIMFSGLKCRAAVDSFEEHRNSIGNFEEFSDIFDIRGIETKCEKNPAHREFINKETIDKINMILGEVRPGSGKHFTNHIINLYKSGDLKEIPKYIEIKSLSVQLRNKGFGNEAISQFKNNAKGNDQYVNDVGEALRSNKSIQKINSIINRGAPNIQRNKPLKMIDDYNKNLNLHDQSKNTQMLGAK